jgi:WD40 repeat protein
MRTSTKNIPAKYQKSSVLGPFQKGNLLQSTDLVFSTYFGEIVDVLFHPNSEFLVVNVWDFTLKVIDISKKSIVRIFDVNNYDTIPYVFDSSGSYFAFSSDDKIYIYKCYSWANNSL